MVRGDGTILIIPVGEIKRDLADELGAGLLEVLGKRTSVGEPLPAPVYAFDRERRQYNSTVVIYSIMDAMGLSRFERILAITGLDLFAAGLNYVFGEAGAKAAIISTARLQEGFYGRPEDEEALRQRLLTEAVHELGHTYGMGHCPDPYCVMYFSNGLADTDRKGHEFRGACLKRASELSIVRK